MKCVAEINSSSLICYEKCQRGIVIIFNFTKTDLPYLYFIAKSSINFFQAWNEIPLLENSMVGKYKPVDYSL